MSTSQNNSNLDISLTQEVLNSSVKYKNGTIDINTLSASLLTNLFKFFQAKKKENNTPLIKDVYISHKNISFDYQTNSIEEKNEQPNFNSIEPIEQDDSFDRSQLNFFQNPLEISDDSKKEDLIKIINSYEEITESSSLKEEKKVRKIQSKLSLASTLDESFGISSVRERQRSKIIVPMNLSEKFFLRYIETMNSAYICKMSEIYSYLYQNAQNFPEEKLGKIQFLKLLKGILLQFSISDITLIEKIIRFCSFQEAMSFESFISSFDCILNLRLREGLMKYLFLLQVCKKSIRNDKITRDELEIFFKLIFCKLVYEKGVSENISQFLLYRYAMLCNGNKDIIHKEVYEIPKLCIVLETFYSL